MRSTFLLYYWRSFGEIKRLLEVSANKFIVFDVIFQFLKFRVKLQGSLITIGWIIDVKIYIGRVNLLFNTICLCSLHKISLGKGEKHVDSLLFCVFFLLNKGSDSKAAVSLQYAYDCIESYWEKVDLLIFEILTFNFNLFIFSLMLLNNFTRFKMDVGLLYGGKHANIFLLFIAFFPFRAHVTDYPFLGSWVCPTEFLEFSWNQLAQVRLFLEWSVFLLRQFDPEYYIWGKIVVLVRPFHKLDLPCDDVVHEEFIFRDKLLPSKSNKLL